MILNLITLATVKTQLGITDGTYDTQITAMIPIVSNDVRRILNTNYDCYTLATITNGSDEIELGDSSFRDFSPESIFDMGQVVYSPGLPVDSYIISFDPDTSIYTLDGNATADADYLYPTLTIGQWPAVSKMIFYKIGKQTTSAADVKAFKQIRYGNVSKSFSDGEINKKYDYPEIYIKELGTPFAKVG